MNRVEAKRYLLLTEYCHNNVILKNLNGTSGDEVQASENIAFVDQSVARRGVGCFKF